MFPRKGRTFQIAELEGNSVVDVHEFALPLIFGKKITTSQIETSNIQFGKPLPKNIPVVKITKSHFIVHAIGQAPLILQSPFASKQQTQQGGMIRGENSDFVYTNIEGRVFCFSFADKIVEHHNHRRPWIQVTLLMMIMLGSAYWALNNLDKIQSFTTKLAARKPSPVFTIPQDEIYTAPMLNYPVKRAAASHKNAASHVEVVEYEEVQAVVVGEQIETAVIAEPQRSMRKSKKPMQLSDLKSKLSGKLASQGEITFAATIVPESSPSKVTAPSKLQVGSKVSVMAGAMNNFDNTHSSRTNFEVIRPVNVVSVASEQPKPAPTKGRDQKYPAQWDTQVKDRLPQARQCFDEHSQLVKEGDSEYFMDINIAPTGAISSIKLSGGQLPKKIQNCINDRVKRWTLSPASTTNATISVPIVLRQG